jgi:hypothetical protein
MEKIKVGDYLISESYYHQPVKVIGIEKNGDFLTDEPEGWDCNYFYIIQKEKAIKIDDVKAYERKRNKEIKKINKGQPKFDPSNYW